MQNRFKAAVVSWNWYKGYGYLAVDPRTTRIFFHRSALLNVSPGEVQRGDPVSFAFGEYNGKLCAIDVMRLAARVQVRTSERSPERRCVRAANTERRRVRHTRSIAKRADFHFKVPARSDRKHSWKQHANADSYAYQILGRWEKLAAMNEGFVFETTATTAKHAHHYRKDDVPVRHVAQRIKRFCREKGVISDETWGANQFGHRVRGFWLANHALCCRVIDGFHVFFSEYNEEARRARLTSWLKIEREEAMKLQQSCSEVALKLHPPLLEVAPEFASEVALNPPTRSERTEDTKNDRRFGGGSDMLFGGQEPYYPFEPYELRHETRGSLRAPSGIEFQSDSKADGRKSKADRNPERPWYETLLAASKLIEKTGSDGLQRAALIARLCWQKNREWPRTLDYYLKASEHGPLDQREDWEVGCALECALGRLAQMLTTPDEIKFFRSIREVRALT